MAPERSHYDLHTHTCWSYDATNPVEEVFRAAGELGLSTIAIADHHVMDAIPEALELSSQYPEITYIVAAELTVTSSVGAVDLVCLGLPPRPDGQLARVLDEYHDWQRRIAAWLIEGIQALGLDHTPEEHDRLLASYRPEKAIRLQGRTHIKLAIWRGYLREKGIIGDDDSYWTLLGRIGREFRPAPQYPAASRVAPAVKSTGALISIAHPTERFERDNRARMDLLVEECLLDGIECGHRTVPDELVGVYRSYCLERGLVSTAGGDAHGPAEVPDRLGMHKGAPEWLDEVMERLPRRD